MKSRRLWIVKKAETSREIWITFLFGSSRNFLIICPTRHPLTSSLCSPNFAFSVSTSKQTLKTLGCQRRYYRSWNSSFHIHSVLLNEGTSDMLCWSREKAWGNVPVSISMLKSVDSTNSLVASGGNKKKIIEAKIKLRMAELIHHVSWKEKSWPIDKLMDILAD